MSEYRAVFFDFDDTLGNRNKYAYDCFRKIISENAVFDDEMMFEAVLQDCLLWDERGIRPKEEIKDKLAAKYGILLPYPDFNAYWHQQLWKHAVAFEDAESVLTKLKERYILGLITNGPSDSQRLKLKASGLEHFFDPDKVFVSGDYSYAKPDVRLFHKACAVCGVKPAEAVHVGDLFASDVLGAYRAGLSPIWMKVYGDDVCLAHVTTIHKLSDLLALL